jgi:hypothetical protein
MMPSIGAISMSKANKSVVLAIAASIIFEAVTFYGYSWLFLLEGEPQRHNDPQLQTWAGILLGAMFAGFLAFIYWIVRICKS